MKKVIILAGFWLLSISLFSQSFYLKPVIGYAFGIQGDSYNLTSYHYFQNEDTSYSINSYARAELKSGNGPVLGLTIGKEFSKNIAFELNGFYSKTKTDDIGYTEIYSFSYDVNYDATFKYKYNFENKIIRFIPEIVLKTGDHKIDPYMKVGVIFGFVKMKENYEMRLTNDIPTMYPFEDENMVIEYERTFSAGISSAFGCDLQPSENLCLFAEANYNYFSSKPTKAEVTEYKYRGEDKLSTLTYQERYFEYVEAFSDNDNADPFKSAKFLIQKYSFNNISMLVGLKFKFSKNSKEK